MLKFRLIRVCVCWCVCVREREEEEEEEEEGERKIARETKTVNAKTRVEPAIALVNRT